MRKVLLFCCLVIGVAGCDLQPKIASIPDSIGDFISERYPTLLADPDSEIYQTAVSDYGVYSSPVSYGNGDSGVDDYVLYSSADDYSMPAQSPDIEDSDVGMPQENEPVEDQQYGPDDDIDDLIVPDYVKEHSEQKVNESEQKKQEQNKTKPESEKKPIGDVIVAKGDTLYALARKHAVTADDLAIANNISAPFKLYVGQKLKLPDSSSGAIVQKAETKQAEAVKEAHEKIKKSESGHKTVRVASDVREITVEKGDTLYSLSRKYAVPVNELAVMNKIGAPFALSVGQKIKVPDLSVASDKKTESEKSMRVANDRKTVDKPVAQAKKESVKKDVKNIPGKTGDKAKPANSEKASKKSDVKKGVAKSDKVEKKTEKQATTVKQESKVVAKKIDSKKSEGTKKRSVKQNNQKMMARSSSKFSWPVRGRILSGYGSKTNGLFNDGINIKATRGTTVNAAENGYVAYAGNEVKGMGNLVIIQHSDGWMTVYAHMDSFVVRRGHSVAVGQKIGTVGASGKVDQPQLHFEIRKGTKAYNPISYLKK